MLLKAKLAIWHLYHDKNKLNFNEMMMFVFFVFFKSQTILLH